MPAPKIGSVVTSKTETTRIDQPIKQKFRAFTPADFAMARETRNVTAPNSDERPSTWRKITPRETAEDAEKSIPVRGKYSVHPAESPSWYEIPSRRSWIAKTLSQKAKLLSLGVAKSIPAYVCGSKKLPKAEMIPGMMKRKTIPSPWLVTAL